MWALVSLACAYLADALVVEDGGVRCDLHELQNNIELIYEEVQNYQGTST